MNKWEDSFKKISVEETDNQGLFIPNRQLSIVVAVFLFLAFSLFMTGYFLGKKKAVEQFTQEMQQDAFADKIYTTVLSTQPAQESEQPTSDALLVANVEDIVAPSPLISHEEIAATEVAVIEDAHLYYAQLIGFGTEKAAQSFVKKLAAKGIETEVKKRASKTVKGQPSYWYQVVTTQYANKNDLVALVDRLAKEENIKDARVCAC